MQTYDFFTSFGRHTNLWLFLPVFPKTDEFIKMDKNAIVLYRIRKLQKKRHSI